MEQSQTLVISPTVLPAPEARPVFGHLADPVLRREARRLWKEAAHAKNISAGAVAAYHVLLGGKLDQAFTPLSNPVKIANGMAPDGAREAALRAVRNLHADAFRPWESLLTGFFAQARYGRLPDDAGKHPLIAATRHA